MAYRLSNTNLKVFFGIARDPTGTLYSMFLIPLMLKDCRRLVKRPKLERITSLYPMQLLLPPPNGRK